MDSLIVEAIQIYGIDVKYLPKTIVKHDLLLNEDVLMKYDSAIDMEMYIKNTMEFGGQGDFLSKFNLEIRDQITFVMAKSRWPILTANTAASTSSRPMEGDLIFFPFNNKLYEIKFVEHEKIFYQHGRLYTYELTCELFDRDSRLDTGNTVIDTIYTNTNMNILENQLLDENNNPLTDENGGYILQEYRLEDTNKGANNTSIGDIARDYVDFSEKNPLVDD